MKSYYKTFMWITCAYILCLVNSSATGNQNARYVACPDHSRAGLYWVDTTSGKTWWTGPTKWKWVYCGRPKEAMRSTPGTYCPFENKSGEGVFILDTLNGQGWWTDGETWRFIGLPAVTGSEELEPGAAK